MADFCNFCAKEMFGDVEPDIDVYKIFEETQIDYYTPCICEGCGLVAIMRTINDELKVCYAVGYDEKGNINTYTDWVDYTNKFNTKKED